MLQKCMTLRRYTRDMSSQCSVANPGDSLHPKQEFHPELAFFLHNNNLLVKRKVRFFLFENCKNKCDNTGIPPKALFLIKNRKGEGC